MTDQNDSLPPPSDGAALGRELSAAVVLFHEAVAHRLGLGAADHKALELITRYGPLPAGEIARHTGLNPASVTALVDRLERAGYARRHPDPADRRRVLVAAEGQATGLAPIFAELGREMAEMMTRYDEGELAVIADWATRTADVLRRQTRRLHDESD
jgi:DNA-binding MarR family transcriptional regulator